jgi:hypothetical protein
MAGLRANHCRRALRTSTEQQMPTAPFGAERSVPPGGAPIVAFVSVAPRREYRDDDCDCCGDETYRGEQEGWDEGAVA